MIDFEGETGAEFDADTGELVQRGELDLSVWAYLRMGSGFTVCVTQMPPQPMLEWMGTAAVPPQAWTVNVARGLVTFLEQHEVDGESYRVAFDSLPDDVADIVWNQAGSGWFWADVEWRFDLDTNTWVKAKA